MNELSQTPCCGETHCFSLHIFDCLVSLCVFAINAKFDFSSEYAVHCQKRSVLLSVLAKNAPFFGENAWLHSTFRQKHLIRSENAQLQRQRLVSLRIFGECAQLCYSLLPKKIFENVCYTVFGIY